MRSRICWLTLLAAVTAGCSKKPDTAKAGGPPPAAPVVVATVEQRSFPVDVRATGHVEPYSTVTVKAQVGGQLLRVHFTEGGMVEKGQLLFEIDARPQQEVIRQLEANLARDAAQAHKAQADAARYSELLKSGIVARQEYEQVAASAAAWQATLDAARAAVENARVRLQYASIYSPITGRTGNLMVKEGNLVTANDSALVTIHQIEPIYVAFSVPEKELPEIQARFGSGLRVRATAAGDSRTSLGRLSFVDNAVDSTTGTIRMKATFANSDHRLWPGQMVDAAVSVSQRPDAVVVPSRAVRSGENGPYVYVVTQDNRAEYRGITILNTAGDAAAVSGVWPGEQVVVEEQAKIAPGVTVRTVQE